MNTENSELKGEKSFVIDVNVSNLIMTPLTCASLVNEMLKGLLYQKSQIPYPYSWMKTVLERKRQRNENEPSDSPINLSAANHFRIVSKAYEILQSVMQGVIEEFRESVLPIDEVVIVFGTTPQCPEEILTITIPSLARGHFEGNHLNELNKAQPKVLRNIFLSQSWMDSIDTSLICTNTYVYLKKSVTKSRGQSVSQSVFVPVRPLMFSPKVKHVRINLCSDNHRNSNNCCQNLMIYTDDDDRVPSTQEQKCCENTKNEVVWFQFRDLIEGYKDCFINKKSASELW
ncbi:uncharacterized protein [Leptinotarsa decemlineata]|uniref:uncharacterized protein n=1 Tax=Leptinotarsa decemlineata TaxID=7539 RepID=UPI003D30470C